MQGLLNFWYKLNSQGVWTVNFARPFWKPYVVAILPNFSPYVDVRLSECPLGGAAILFPHQDL